MNPTESTLAGRYELLGMIGRGGLGEVLLAKDLVLDRLLAIKRLHPAEQMDGSAAENAVREARTLAALMHPNVVTIFDIFQYGRDVLVAMEYVNGKNLQEIGELAPLVLPDFLDIAKQCLAGLDAAHARGILHRDIKPGNVMATNGIHGEIVVKILDFGLAALAENVGTAQTGEVLGSVYTMAPEQFEQRGEDARTDLYSLGCVFYFVLAGRYPFSGEDVNEVIYSHLDHKVVPIADARKDIPPPLADWIMSLISVSPDNRPSSAVEASKSLKLACASSGISC